MDREFFDIVLWFITNEIFLFQFPVELGVSLAVLFCVLISLSRLYLGMHSLLVIWARIYRGNENNFHKYNIKFFAGHSRRAPIFFIISDTIFTTCWF